MEVLIATATDFIMTSSQDALCFLLRIASVLTGIALCVRYFNHWRVWIPIAGICLLVLVGAPKIAQHVLVPLTAELVKTILWLCVLFLFLALPILLIIRWIATSIISHFQQLTHRCKGCIYNQTSTCTKPGTCNGQ